jgi:trans-2-enoyl-CoA reductase
MMSRDKKDLLRKVLIEKYPDFQQENNKIVVKVVKIENLSEVTDMANLKDQLQNILS